MNIVQDTNVFISAVISDHGASSRCLERCLRRQDTAHFGAALLAEHEEKVESESIWAPYGITKAERRLLLDSLLRAAQWTNVFVSWRPNLPDPDDEHVYELALSAQAERLVTSNIADFLRADLKPFPNPLIVTPAQHLKTL